MLFSKKKAKKEEKVAKKETKKEAPKKEAPKKVEPKKATKEAPKKAAPKAAPAAKKVEEKADSTRVYHVVKRAEDNMWEVKFAGGQKAIKLFKTQKEAIEYSKKMAENQDGAMLVHNSKGQNKGRIKSR